MTDRNQAIIRTSGIGIAANILLVVFKAIVGFIAGSIAIVMDAVNNLSDVLSSVITIVGTKLSARPADKEHPFGHGRIEYFSAILIAVLVLIAGVSSMVESVKKIIHPTPPEYSTVTLIVIIVAIIIKLFLGRYVKRRGEELNSDALKASGADALFDSVVTTGTLLTALLMLFTGIDLDGIVGALIACVVIKAGYDMLIAPVSQLLGTPVPAELKQGIIQEVLKEPGVNGVFDVILNYYGPSTIIGSLHVSVLDTTTAREIHLLTRHISDKLWQCHGIIVTVGIYAINSSERDQQLRIAVLHEAVSQPHVMLCHAFYVFEDKKLITIDIIPDRTVTDDDSFRKAITRHFEEKFPGYKFDVDIDHIY
ncbi:MAG: cation diffusion facilitator family transporter [Prevotellaceae bacterium]|nr:cation diffusion facilitator family transporter [Prevotellaceae bacterium]